MQLSYGDDHARDYREPEWDAIEKAKTVKVHVDRLYKLLYTVCAQHPHEYQNECDCGLCVAAGLLADAGTCLADVQREIDVKISQEIRQPAE